MSQRDGSLIRRKQEQWARERADEQNSAWFPFGRPGGGSPNRAFSSRNPENSSAEVYHASSYSSFSHNYLNEENDRNEVPPPIPPKPPAPSLQQEYHPPVPGPRRSSDASNPEFPPQPLFCANPMLPYQVPLYGPPTWLPQGMSAMPFMYNMLPPGTIPIPVQVVNESLQNGDPICPVTMLQNMQNMTQMNTQIPGLMMAPPGSNHQIPAVPSKQEQFQTTNVNEVASSVASISLNSGRDSRPSTGNSNEAPIPRPRVSREEDEYERVEREKREQRWREEERERVEKERRDQRRREDEERRMIDEREEELRKSRDRTHSAVLEALEKAQREAGVMKKARLYKHVIEGSEEKPELEKKLLGVDTEQGEEILKQVTQFERQRKYEDEALQKKKTVKPAVDQNANHLPQPRSRASSIGGESDPPPALSRSSLGRSSLRTPTTRKNSSAGKENKWNSNENIANASPLKMGTLRGEMMRPQTVETTVIRRTTTSFDSEVPLNKKTSPLGSANRYVDVAALPSRPSTLRSISDVSNPLFSPISTRSRKMRPTADSPVIAASPIGGGAKTEGSSSGSTSPVQSPVPQIRIELDTKAPLIAAEEILSKMRSRSVVSSPTYTAPGRASPLASSIYARKIAEKGCNTHDEDRLSPDIRRKAESNLSRQSSMASLNGSLYNLRGSVSNLSAVGLEESPNLGRYRVMNPAYRSFNVKKASDRQKETLDRLTRLREQLRAKENFMDRPLSRHGSNLSVRQ